MDDSVVRDPRKRYRRVTHVPGESMTETSHAEAADINWIVRRFATSGSFPQATSPAVYADVTQLQGDLQERLAWADMTIKMAQALETASAASGAGAGGGAATSVAPPPSEAPQSAS